MQWLPLSRHTAQTSPGTTRFFLSIHLPHLSYLIPCSYWASTCIAALPSCMTLYEISVRQTRDLPVVSLFPHPASFRFHLTVDTLAFGYILPTTGRIRDFNPLETCAAGRTTIKNRTSIIECTVLFCKDEIRCQTADRIEVGACELICRLKAPLHWSAVPPCSEFRTE